MGGCGGSDSLGRKRPDGAADGRFDGGAGADAACVPLGSVAFRMEAPPTDGGYLYLSSLDDPGDGVWWYALETPDGSALPIFLPPGAFSTCDVCDPKPEPIGQGCGPIPDGGVSREWGGYTVTGMSTCQPPQTSSIPTYPSGCATTRCLPAGRYVVKMCGGRGICPYGDAGTCVEVPFDFPTDHEVVGHLPP
jgi:hypothetical protein